MPIYVITSGTDDDYHVVTCTTDPEAAKRALEFAKQLLWDGNSAQIEICEDCKEVFIDMNLDKRNFYNVYIDESTNDITVKSFIPMSFEYCKKLMLDGTIHTKYGTDPIYNIDCCAEDEEHAKKIAFDVISKYKSDAEDKHDA